MRQQGTNFRRRVLCLRREGAEAVPEFDDVKPGAFYFDAAVGCKNGITNGTGKKHLLPNDVCSRYQIVMFLWRARPVSQERGITAASELCTDTRGQIVTFPLASDSDIFYEAGSFMMGSRARAA